VFAGIIILAYGSLGKKWGSQGAAGAALPVTIATQHLWYSSTASAVRVLHGAVVTALVLVALFLFWRLGHHKRAATTCKVLNWLALALAYILPLIAYLPFHSFDATSLVVLMVIVGLVVATVAAIVFLTIWIRKRGRRQPPKPPKTVVQPATPATRAQPITPAGPPASGAATTTSGQKPRHARTPSRHGQQTT
jgi:hypothetical protein